MDPSVIPHGDGGYTDYGCRCQVCTQEHTAARRRQTGAQPAKTWTEEEIARALHVYATEGFRAAERLGIANGSTIRRWAQARGVTCYQRPEKHGVSRYTYARCRCETCVTAHREAVRAGRADRLSRLDEAPHGTETAYINWGCRCDPCKAAGSEHNRKVRLRREERLTRK